MVAPTLVIIPTIFTQIIKRNSYFKVLYKARLIENRVASYSCSEFMIYIRCS